MLETSPKGVSPLDSLGLITSFPFRGINYRAGVPFKGLLKGVPVFRAVMPPLITTAFPVPKGRLLSAVATFASLIDVG